MDAEGFLERERRWLEGVFAASRPEDLSCLFQDAGGSAKLNTDDFFPMVLNERVAWSEFMEIARAALFKQAEPIVNDKPAALVDANSGNKRGKGRSTIDTGAGGVATSGTASGVPTPNLEAANMADAMTLGGGLGSVGGGENAREALTLQQQKRHRHGKLRGRQCDRANDSNNTRDNSDNYGNGTVRRNKTSREVTITGGWNNPSNRSNTVPVAVPLTIGQTLRGTTGAGPNGWSLFRFELPSSGPVLTIVLDAIDGDPELLVSAKKVPTVAAGAAATSVADWESSSKYGGVSVVKIFPHHLK